MKYEKHWARLSLVMEADWTQRIIIQCNVYWFQQRVTNRCRGVEALILDAMEKGYAEMVVLPGTRGSLGAAHTTGWWWRRGWMINGEEQTMDIQGINDGVEQEVG